MRNNHFLLVTLDLDYTIFLGNSVLFLNKMLGISEKLEEYHTDYHNRKISEREMNLRQLPFLQKISLSNAYETLTKGPILKNLDTGVRLLQNRGADVQMLTFNPFQLFFTKYYGIKSDISLLCGVDGDHLGEMKEVPENKVELLKQFCSRNGIEFIRCVHVGDSLNDVATFRIVGYSVALNSSDASVEQEACISLRTHDFAEVAYTILQVNELA